MGKKKVSKTNRDESVRFRCEKEWIEQVKEAAERLGLSISAYIRLATNERLQRDAQARGN